MKYYKCPSTNWVGYFDGQMHCLIDDSNIWEDCVINDKRDIWLNDGTLVEITENEFKQIKLERL